jgi:hypothetical protein
MGFCGFMMKSMNEGLNRRRVISHIIFDPTLLFEIVTCIHIYFLGFHSILENEHYFRTHVEVADTGNEVET